MNVVTKNNFKLLPAAPETCPECATPHSSELPHNLWSLYYKMKFAMANGRQPTLEDAMAHCTEEMKERWRTATAEVLSEETRE